jgi:8-oxo-dGTP pyrophosphatase MutT (NUDIX family)
MCRLESWAFESGRVSFGLSRTSYKHFWGTNLTHPEYADRYGPGVMANPVGVSPALETADGFLLLGRRNALVAYYPTRVHPFAGCLEPSDAAAGEAGASRGAATDGAAPDVFAAVIRELAEELRLTAADVELVRLTGLVEDVRLRQPD